MSNVATTVRFSAEDLAAIDARARQYGLDRTHFLRDAALNRLPDATATELERLQDRMERLESYIWPLS